MTKSLEELKRIGNYPIDLGIDNSYEPPKSCGTVSIGLCFQEEFDLIKQDLERLETLEKVWAKEEWCEGVPLNVESLKSLFKYNEELFEKNLELDKENEILKQSVKDTYDSSQEIIFDLKKENQELKEEMETLKKYDMELFTTTFKLKKAIDILKEVVSLNINKILETERHLLSLTQQEYELLKEVLENEMV